MSHAIDITQLTKTYAGGHRALCGIDLHVEEGDFFALLGPNGAGKSTTIGIIASLVNMDAGRVSIFGHDLVREPMAARRQIGLVPQEFNFNMFEPVEEIVINQAGYYGLEGSAVRARCEVLLRELGLWEKRREMARNLSGGMKRRLMIARALIHAPRLLILDEPTAGVDIELRRSMWQFLREVNRQGTTIVLTTHYLEEAELLCRNIAIIDQGRIAAHTSMKALLNRLNCETLVLDLMAPIDAPPHLVGVDCGVVQVDAHTLEVTVSRGQGLSGLFAALAAAGVEVLSMRNKSNRLEELFLSLVAQGRQAQRGVGEGE